MNQPAPAPNEGTAASQLLVIVQIPCFNEEAQLPITIGAIRVRSPGWRSGGCCRAAAGSFW